MFTWICPKCGTEVPPSYNDCPNCAAREKAAAAAPVSAPPPPVVAPAPPPMVYSAPPAPAPVAPAPAPVAPSAPYKQPPLMGTVPIEDAIPMAAFSYGSAPLQNDAPPLSQPAGGMPGWAIALLSIVGFAAVGYGIIHFMGSRGAGATETSATETAAPTGTPSSLSKYVEVVGFRIVEANQKVQLKFIIVNHAAGEIAPFELDLQVRTKNQKPDEAPLFSIKTPVQGVLPFEAKDMTIPVKTSLRAYEIPDWQFLTGTFQIIQQ